MKKSFLLLALLAFINVQAQFFTATEPLEESGGFIGIQTGYDVAPIYNNNTPYINYKGGIYAAFSTDYYFDWYGMGLDFNYIKNSPNNTYPTDSLFVCDRYIGEPSLEKESIQRIFIGIGPNVKYQKNNFLAELNTRFGIGSVSGGKLLLRTDNENLNYHAGYQFGSFSIKAQLRFSFFYNKHFGVSSGIYYINHLNGREISLNRLSAFYQSYNLSESGTQHQLLNNSYYHRDGCTDCNISSLGVFVSASYALHFTSRNNGSSKNKGKAKYSIVIIVKDRYTKEVIPNANIIIKDLRGKVIYEGETNSLGKIYLDNIKRDYYVVKGEFKKKKIRRKSIKKSEFKAYKTLEKILYYSAKNIILKGKVSMCKSDTIINDITVTLRNKSKRTQKTQIINNNEEFEFVLKSYETYELTAKKDSFVSKPVIYNSKNLLRKKHLFIKSDICIEKKKIEKKPEKVFTKEELTKGIKFGNIYYDFNKWNIREDANPELIKLVTYMKEHPNVHVDISSHTDSRADNNFNMILSQKRAESAIQYLIEHGIDKNRISGKGYGETKLLNKCSDGVKCTEEEHQLNRRTEMKIRYPNEENYPNKN